MAEFFKKPDFSKPKPDFGKVVFPISDEKKTDDLAARRAEAQKFISESTNIEDYRHAMWELHENYRKNALFHADGVQHLDRAQQSPAAFTYDPNVSKVDIEARRIEHARSQAESELAQQAIWSGMQAWGLGQRPSDAFFRQLRVSISDAEQRETEAFEQSMQIPADPYRLETWKQLARKKQVLINFERYLKSNR